MGTLVMQSDLYRTHTFFDAINFGFRDYEGSSHCVMVERTKVFQSLLIAE